MILLKIGGGATINLTGTIADIATLKEPCIIVHGANAYRDQLAQNLGKTKQIITSVSGYSSVFSDESAIDLLMMAYAGYRNTRLVELCQQHGINAIGLTGLDGRLIQGQRNKGIRVQEGEKVRIVRDFSGKPKSINKALLETLMSQGYTPVLSVPIIDENGFAINSENDDIVALLQETFRAEKIIHLIEAPGFLNHKDDSTSLVSKLSREELPERESQVEGRMKRKMLALRKLFEAGAQTVILSDGRVEHPVLDALQGKGTLIQ